MWRVNIDTSMIKIHNLMEEMVKEDDDGWYNVKRKTRWLSNDPFIISLTHLIAFFWVGSNALNSSQKL